MSRDVKFIHKDSDWKNNLDQIQEEHAVEVNHEVDVPDEFFSADEESDVDSDENEELTAGDNSLVVPVVKRESSRSTKGNPPKRLIEEINFVNDAVIEPKNLKQVMASNQKNQWIDAMKDEMESLRSNGTWDLCELPKDRTAIGSKWVFKKKTSPDGTVKSFKARLVAQGFSQKFGSDYDLVFAPVVRQTTFRLLLSIAAKENFHVRHFDAKTAFLNGELKETIFMKQPPGFVEEGKENHVCLLRRSIYGLKQSARIWNKAIHQVLLDAGYTQSKNDPCLYTYSLKGKFCFVLIYVDDLIIASKYTELMSACEEILNAKFKIKNLGEIQNYLGLQIKRNENGDFAINQAEYILKVINDFGLANAKISEVPINISYGKGAESEMLINNEKYRQLIGCLLYISVNTRPDISASVSILAQKVSNPNEEDWNELKRVLKYLKGTANLSLLLGKSKNNTDLVGYADANWAENRIDRKSNSGYVFSYLGGTVSWSCKRQSCVSISSTEAEFIALSEACKEAHWIRRLLEDFNRPISTSTNIFEDNQSCLKLIKEEKLSGRSKHIDVRYYFVKDYIEKGFVDCTYCPTENMVADLLTKPLPASRIKMLRSECGVKIFE